MFAITVQLDHLIILILLSVIIGLIIGILSTFHKLRKVGKIETYDWIYTAKESWSLK